jgi:hypothetical protein
MRGLRVATLLLLLVATAGASLAGDQGEAGTRRAEPPQKRPAPPTLVEVAPVEETVETLKRLRFHPGRDSLDVSETARARQPVTHR